jgi:hypothetical protein
MYTSGIMIGMAEIFFIHVCMYMCHTVGEGFDHLKTNGKKHGRKGGGTGGWNDGDREHGEILFSGFAGPMVDTCCKCMSRYKGHMMVKGARSSEGRISGEHEEG